MRNSHSLHTMRVARFITLAVIGIGASLNATEARGKTLVVTPQGPTTSVADAVAQAAAGDLIRIEAGLYTGNLVLDKPLTLEGSGRAIIRGLGRGSVITVLAPGCTLRGLVIEHSGGQLIDEDSGILVKSRGNLIENNDLRDVLFGIYLFQADDNTVRRNTIRGRSELGLGERGSGIHIWNSKRNLIADNVITQMRDGMYLQYASQSTIRGNRIFDLRYGLHYMNSDDNTFDENIFHDNVAGAAIMYSRRIRFRRNIFWRNRGFSSYGILFQDCEECWAEENFILDNATGVFMEALRHSVFRRNVIAGNDVALQIFSSAEANLLVENVFVENLSPLRLVGRRTTTRWSSDGRGNFWSDYEGYDLDGNGIGDVPHKIQNVFEYLEGNYPRLRLYLSSPAAQALALAEKLFPILPGSGERDTAPLMTAAPPMAPFAPPQASRHPGLALLSLVMVATASIVWTVGRRR